MNKKGKRTIGLFVIALVFITAAVIVLNNNGIVYNLQAIDYEHIAQDLALWESEKENALDDSSIAAQDTTYDVTQNDKVILIDPGHGGDDPGCNYDGILESNINLEISMLLKERLENLGFEIIMTRDADIRLTLAERVALIKSYDPDFFISIHQNSLDDDTVTHGAETLYNNTINDDCAVFAEYIQNALVLSTGVKDRGIKIRNNLAVLKNITCPGSIVETGFLSSTDERLRLNSLEYQELIVDGIISGLLNYINDFMPVNID